MNHIELFDTLKVSDIESFHGREETLHLEFKTITKPDFSSRDDRKNLAIALSGFGNSDGGLIVWGVDARKKDGIDRVEGQFGG